MGHLRQCSSPHAPLDMDEFWPTHEHGVVDTLAMAALHAPAFLLSALAILGQSKNFIIQETAMSYKQ